MIRRIVRKSDFGICENKGADQLRSKCAADQRLSFRYIVQFLNFLNPKFSASSRLWLYSPVCVGPGQNCRRQVFSFVMAWLITVAWILSLLLKDRFSIGRDDNIISHIMTKLDLFMLCYVWFSYVKNKPCRSAAQAVQLICTFIDQWLDRRIPVIKVLPYLSPVIAQAGLHHGNISVWKMTP